MKKIYALLLLFVAALALTSCGPNQDYYRVYSDQVERKVPTLKLTIANEKAIDIDPYQLLLDVKADVGDRLKDATLDTLKAAYNVTVEYRVSGDNMYKTFTLTDNKIYEANPATGAVLQINKTYDFKIHFVDKQTQSDKDRINLIVTYNFVASLGVKQAVVNTQAGSYNLLNNIQSLNDSGVAMTPAEIKAKYTPTYTVTKAGAPVTVNGDEVALTAGTYDVKVVLKEIGTDGNSGASGTEPAETPSYTLNYQIVVG